MALGTGHNLPVLVAWSHLQYLVTDLTKASYSDQNCHQAACSERLDCLDGPHPFNCPAYTHTHIHTLGSKSQKLNWRKWQERCHENLYSGKEADRLVFLQQDRHNSSTKSNIHFEFALLVAMLKKDGSGCVCNVVYVCMLDRETKTMLPLFC